MWSFRRLRLTTLAVAVAVLSGLPVRADPWTDAERAVLRSLWIGSLPPLPPAPSNRYADDARVAAFGHRLFFDTRLSANGKIACASCHVPALDFTDGRVRSVGIGPTIRNAPSIVGAAWSRWLFWDGRKDSLWSQALAPLESPTEHGMTRARIVAVIRGDADLRQRYDALFGELPAPGDKPGTTRAFVNLGKAIAAYERTLRPGPSKFDRWVAALLRDEEPAPADRLSLDEEQGLRIFIDDNRGRCLRCHTGPLFTDGKFHNIGVAAPDGIGTQADAEGRPAGFRAALQDEFGCFGRFSDAPPSACADIRAASEDSQLAGTFKTPGLRNVARTAPYMHTGGIDSLDNVMWHYLDRPKAAVGRTELEPFTLTTAEFEQILAFLRTLDGPVLAPDGYLRPPAGE